MKYFILAGEASGDMHSAALAIALRERDPQAVLFGWGGDEMEKAGVQILKHYRDLAFMGFVEVLRHLPAILRNFRLVKRVHYYISPQLWAWKEGRVKQVKKYVDQMYVILPFEKAFYTRHGIDVHYVGHPLAWRIDQLMKAEPQAVVKRIVLLPGSRRREIQHMLPTMLEAVKDLKGYQIYIAGAPSVPAAFYYSFISTSGLGDVTLTFGYTYKLLRSATAALCTSGTATLETALFNVPQVVCYRGDVLSYMIARRLVKVPYIAIVNLICEKGVVPELIQKEFNVARLSQELQCILDPERRSTMLSEYALLRQRLDTGNPAQKVADLVIAELHKS